MTGPEILVAMRESGHTVALSTQRRIEVRPRLDDATRATVLARRAEIVNALEAERYCQRCRLPGPRLVSAYWSTTERYCSPCCATMTADMDGRRSWPLPPSTLHDPATTEAGRRIDSERDARVPARVVASVRA